MPDDDLSEQTRRAILKGAAATLGVAGASGVASAHPGSGDHGPKDHTHDHVDEVDMSTVGYHSLGRRGSEDPFGSPDRPHHGGISELRVKGDIAACGILSSHDPTTDRGVAILDVSAYTRAGPDTNLDDVEMSVVSFVPNENQGTSIMDLKFSDDGQYLFTTRQPVAAAFEGTGTEKNPGPEEHSRNAEHGGIFAYDVSDPTDPERVGQQVYGFGLHNCYHHRIGGEDYVFGVTGPLGDPAGIYVHRFDRSGGGLHFVNYWSHDTELRQGEAAEPVEETYAHGNEYYAHDIAVIDDPISGDPYAYLANWNSGARVLDVSDPTDIKELGRFEMERAHTIEPIRRTVDEKRLFVVGQENPGPDGDTKDDNAGRDDLSDGHTGYYYLVDATPVETGKSSVDLGHASKDGQATPDDGTIQVNGNSRVTELAKWVWRHDAEYDNYTYSAHNIDVVDTTVGGERALFVTVGHYHAGTRLLEISNPETSRSPTDVDSGSELSEGGIGSGRTDWGLTEVGWSRTVHDVADDAKFGSLSAATPYHWCAVEENGVIFASCISTGVYAMTLDDPALPIGTRTVHEASVSRTDDGSVSTADFPNHVELTVDTEAEVLVRDRVPSSWTVTAGDPHEVRTVADGKLVEFTEPVRPAGHSDKHTSADGTPTREYYARSPAGGPSDTGTYTFGPVEVSTDGGETWEALPNSEDTNAVVGFQQP